MFDFMVDIAGEASKPENVEKENVKKENVEKENVEKEPHHETGNNRYFKLL
jgi:hypothetical protein